MPVILAAIDRALLSDIPAVLPATRSEERVPVLSRGGIFDFMGLCRQRGDPTDRPGAQQHRSAPVIVGYVPDTRARITSALSPSQ